MHAHSVAAVRVFALLTALSATAASAQYSYSKIADSATSHLQSFDQGPQLNASGMVAFSGATATGPGLYRWQNGVATAVPGLTAYASFFNPSLSSAGDLAFRGDYPTGAPALHDVVLCRSGQPCTVLLTASTATPYANMSGVQLSDALLTTFAFVLNGGGIGEMTLDQNGTQYFREDTTGTTGSGVSNSADVIVFYTSSPPTGGMVRRSIGGAPATTILDTSGPYSDFTTPDGSSALSENDIGQVSFMATLDAGGSSLSLWQNGTITPIVATGATYSLLGGHVLNEKGTSPSTPSVPGAAKASTSATTVKRRRSSRQGTASTAPR
jgi:hypothetical protein